MQDDRENIKVKPGVKKLVKILSAHMDLTQSDVIKTLAEAKLKELNIKL